MSNSATPDSATSPDRGLVAELSRAHPFLDFGGDGQPLPFLDDDPIPWQRRLHAQNQSWYPGSDAPQVSAAFVLQYLLQVPAQTMAYAVSLGLPMPSPAELTFDLGPGGSPTGIRLGALLPVTDLVAAERGASGDRGAPRHGIPIDCLHRSTGASRLVTDMWAQAVAGGRPVDRESCCFLYALPGCHECGCPRLRTRSGHTGSMSPEPAGRLDARTHRATRLVLDQPRAAATGRG